MLLVRIALMLAALAATLASLLGDVAERLPNGGATVPPACVRHPLPKHPNLQVGYCP